MLLVPQNLIQSPDFTDIDITTWCLCDIVVNSSLKKSDLITVSQLAYQMYDTINVSHSITENIRISMQHLLEEKYLIGNRIGKQYYEIFRDSFYIEDDEYFIKVDENAIHQTFKHLRPFNALRIYLLILSTISPKTKCSDWSKDQLAHLTGKNSTTITRYNKFFEDEKLLYIYRSGNMDDLQTNIYSRYEDREAAKTYGDLRSDGKKLATSANEKRRYTQMYNMVKSRKKTYSPEEMQELREYCEAENERRQKIYTKNPSYDQKLYDLSILI